MKFHDSKYFSNDGISLASVEHLGRVFSATSQLLEEDFDKVSKFTGCRFAEMKAEIRALKYERNLEKQKCEEIRKFVKACCQCKNWDKNSPTAKVVYRQLNKRIKRVNQLADQINMLQQELLIAIRRQDLVTAALQRKKEKDAESKNN